MLRGLLTTLFMTSTALSSGISLGARLHDSTSRSNLFQRIDLKCNFLDNNADRREFVSADYRGSTESRVSDAEFMRESLFRRRPPSLRDAARFGAALDYC